MGEDRDFSRRDWIPAKFSRIAIAGTLAVAGLAGWEGVAQAQNFSKEVSVLIEQAKTEGEVNVSWSDNAFDGSRGAAAFEQGFNAYYGLDVKFNYSPGVAFTAMGTKISEEQKAGRPASTDLLIAGEGQVPLFVHQGILKAIDWKPLIPSLPAEHYNDIVAPDGSLVALYSTWRTLVYNTDHVSEADAPKKLRDFLDPKWKGKTATTSYAAGYGSLTDGSDWTRDQVIDFAKQLAGMLGGVMRCGEYDRLTSGEFWIFGLECEPSRVENLIKKGAPLAQHPAADALRISHWCLGVPKNAQHPATATLLIAFMLSEEGQRLVYQYQGGDLHYLKGSQTAPKIAELEKWAGEKFTDQTPAVLISHEQEQATLQAEVAEILRNTK